MTDLHTGELVVYPVAKFTRFDELAVMSLDAARELSASGAPTDVVANQIAVAQVYADLELARVSRR